MFEENPRLAWLLHRGLFKVCGHVTVVRFLEQKTISMRHSVFAVNYLI